MEEPLNVTKTLYSVADFVEFQKSERLNLRPYFQRGSVWTAKAKSYLIDTLLRGFPIPIIYLQQKTDRQSLSSIRQVVDGQQRLRTILAYVDPTSLRDFEPRDNFTLMRSHNPELAGKTFTALPTEMQDRLLTTELSVHVLPSGLDDKVLLQLFARLNSTGSKVNDQELRNAEYHGEFKTLMYGLSYEQLDRWQSWGTFNPQALAQMREVEFMSDLVVGLVRGPGARSKSMLDTFYKENDDVFPEGDDVTRSIPKIFDDLAALLAPDSKGTTLGTLQTQSWIYTLFSYLALSRHGAPLRSGGPSEPAFDRRKNPDVRRALEVMQSRLVAGDIPRDVAEALRGASTDKASRGLRLEFLRDNLGN